VLQAGRIRAAVQSRVDVKPGAAARLASLKQPLATVRSGANAGIEW
jgi:hypothetical protein